MRKSLIKLILLILACAWAPFVVASANTGKEISKNILLKFVENAFASEDGEQKKTEDTVGESGNTEGQTVEATVEETVPSDIQEETKASVPLAARVRVLEIPEDGFNWRRDWWKYGLMFITLMVGLALAGYFLKVLVKLLNALVCLGFGALGSMVFIAMLTPWVSSWLPQSMQWASKGICGTTGFLLAYGVAGALMQYLRKPLKTDIGSK